MLVEEELEQALRLQRQALALLKWLSENKIDLGFRHDVDLDQALAFGRWAWSNRAALPRKVEPANAEEALAVGRLVASLLDSSFTWQSAPGWVRFSPDAHCFCPMCSWMVERPPLRTRKVRSRDNAGLSG